jgi:hypothetical protein
MKESIQNKLQQSQQSFKNGKIFRLKKDKNISLNYQKF